MTKTSAMWRVVCAAIVTTIVLLPGCEVQDHRVSSFDSAKEKIVTEVYRGDIDQRAMFGSTEPLTAGRRIATWRETEAITLDESSWFFFVDEQPEANWEHAAKLIFVEERTGKLRVFEVSTPPSNLERLVASSPAAELQRAASKRLSESLRDDRLYKVPDHRKLDLSQKKYAVLVSGGVDAQRNYGRYWNDLSSIYKALKDKYHYTDYQIIVLYANGTHSPDEDLDGDGSGDIDFAATKVNLTTAMQIVKNSIAPDGKFFFYATNHGGRDGGYDSKLHLWGEAIRDDEFAALTLDIKARNTIYVMEQCNGGGMLDDILGVQTYPCVSPMVCVMSAARHDEWSWAADTEGEYDEYVYHWTSAVHGQTPTGTAVNADTNSDGAVSMTEAHEYAKSQDSRPEHPLIGSCVIDACDTSLAVP